MPEKVTVWDCRNDSCDLHKSKEGVERCALSKEDAERCVLSNIIQWDMFECPVCGNLTSSEEAAVNCCNLEYRVKRLAEANTNLLKAYRRWELDVCKARLVKFGLSEDKESV